MIQDYSAIIKLCPKDSDAYLTRGSAYLEAKEHEKAIQYFKKVLELNPRNALAKKNLKACHKALGK